MKRLVWWLVLMLLVTGLLGINAPLAMAAVLVDVYPGDNIQAKLATVSVGGTLLVHAGVYHQSIRIEKSVHLVGDGAILDGKAPADPGTNLYIDGIILNPNTTDVVVEGFEVRNYSRIGFFALDDFTQNITVRNNKFYGNDQDLITQAYVHGTTLHNSWTVTNNSFSDRVNFADLRNSLISENLFKVKSGTSEPIVGIVAHNALGPQPTSASNIDFMDNNLSGFNLALFASSEPGHKAILENVRISGNKISDSPANGIWAYVDPATGSEIRSITIQGNNIIGNTPYGITLDNVSHASILNNQLKDNGGAILLRYVTQSTVSGNTSHFNEDGIGLMSSSGNNISNNNSSHNEDTGISLWDHSNNNTIEDNITIKNGAYDLNQSADCTGNTWQDNKFDTKTGF